MNKQNKKAFTIVELVIVIAVIAILAAVLIPTFSNLIEKANESRDISLVKNLNTALVLEEVNNTKNSTLHDALNDTLKHGYTVEKLTPTSSGDILWDEVNNKFALVKNDSLLYGLDVTKEVIAKQSEKLWKITNNVDEVTNENAKYSYYLLDSFEGELNVYTGIDVGNNKDVDKVNYTGKDKARNITFRTNGGTLKINGYVNESDENDGDTVNHYGEGNSIEIIKVATKSYHEFGSVLGNIKINKGRVVLENNSLVSAVVITPENNAKVVVKSNGGQVNSIATTKTENVSIEEISLTLETIDQNKVTEMNLFSGGLGTKESPYLVETEEQFTEIGNLFDDKTPKHFKQIANLDEVTPLYDKCFSGVYDGNGYYISANSLRYTSSNTMSLFGEACGHVTFKNMTINMVHSIVLSLITTVDWATNYGADFENITFNNYSNKLVLECNSNNVGLVVANAIYTKGEATASNPVVYNFKNITNNVNIQNAGTCTGVFIGSGPCFHISTVLNFENCTNNGDITGTESVGVLYGNSAYLRDQTGVFCDVDGCAINVDNCKNTGILTANRFCELAPNYHELNEIHQEKVGGTYVKGDRLKDIQITLTQSGSKFNININNTFGYNYKLMFNVYEVNRTIDDSPWTDENTIQKTELSYSQITRMNGLKFEYESTLNDTTVTDSLKNIHAYDIRTAIANGIVEENEITFNEIGEYVVITKENNNYIIINYQDNYYVDSGVSALVYVYDNNNNIIGLKTVK